LPGFSVKSRADVVKPCSDCLPIDDADTDDADATPWTGIP